MRISPSGVPAIDLPSAVNLPRPSPTVVFCEVEDGAVLLSTTSEVYYGLNQVGACVWALLPPRHLELLSLCRALGQEYPEVDPGILMADVIALLTDLEDAGLVVSGSD